MSTVNAIFSYDKNFKELFPNRDLKIWKEIPKSRYRNYSMHHDPMVQNVQKVHGTFRAVQVLSDIESDTLEYVFPACIAGLYYCLIKVS